MDNIPCIGVDIVKEMIAANKKDFERGNVSFLELDMIRDDLPSVDLILCREVLFHLSFQDLCAAIVNFKKSKSKYLRATHYPLSCEKYRHRNREMSWHQFPAGTHELPSTCTGDRRRCFGSLPDPMET
jgi:Methyltransferase domain